MAGSLMGALFALGALVPSFLLVFFPPRKRPGQLPTMEGPLTAMEYAGRAGCLLVCCFSGDIFTPHFGLLFWCSLVLLVLYWLMWVRFFKGGRDFRLLYAPVGPIPIPMALLPLCLFWVMALWGRSIGLALVTLVLALGHVPSSWRIARALNGLED
ncbi:hypothetical protein [uncultured Ruthenibacterium sp.]|uniref:hypothetical protein n=1 Tax=uncultured Ruthenibacterium sp. TaxID=1905347 RepID=UPI00349ECDE3